MRLALSVALLGLILHVAAPVEAQEPAAGPPPKPAQLEVEFLPGPEGFPFSQAVRAGTTVYLSGMLGTTPAGLAVGGIQPETRQAMENIRATLEHFGATLDDIVKCTVFLADMAEWPRMNEVYAPYFPRHKPARSGLGASGLALNARVEIECIAVLGAAEAAAALEPAATEADVVAAPNAEPERP